MPSRPRILVTVEPRVLGDVLIAVLEALEVDDVVSEADGHRIDAAIVSADALEPLADLVIQLPEDASDDKGWVHADGMAHAVALASTQALLALLDDRLAAPRSRVERAAELAAPARGAS